MTANKELPVTIRVGVQIIPQHAGYRAVRAAWRREAWQLEAPLPRVWRT